MRKGDEIQCKRRRIESTIPNHNDFVLFHFSVTMHECATPVPTAGKNVDDVFDGK